MYLLRIYVPSNLPIRQIGQPICQSQISQAICKLDDQSEDILISIHSKRSLSALHYLLRCNVPACRLVRYEGEGTGLSTRHETHCDRRNGNTIVSGHVAAPALQIHIDRLDKLKAPGINRQSCTPHGTYYYCVGLCSFL